MNPPLPTLFIQHPDDWEDYELLDTGIGARLERIGPYTFVRPEPQAVWSRRLPPKIWDKADGVFQPSGEESGGNWKFRKQIESAWQIGYKNLNFMARTANSRHLGFFPEQAVQWDWIVDKVTQAERQPNVLNLFGYTGIASIAAAQAGAMVTHVDASKKTISQARENQAASGLSGKPIRWIIDDAIKFLKRESRRQVTYDGLILDPPKFGRGPKGEIWEYFQELPTLLELCRAVLDKRPLFFVITAYAIRASALSLYYSVQDMLPVGELEVGELAIKEKSGGRLLSLAIYARWNSK